MSELSDYENKVAEKSNEREHLMPVLQSQEKRGDYHYLGRLELQDKQYIDAPGYEFLTINDKPVKWPLSITEAQQADFKPAQTANTDDPTQPQSGDPMVDAEVLMPPIIVNVREDAWAAKKQAQQEYQQKYASDDSLSELRKESIKARMLEEHANARNTLTEEELHYFKVWGNNVCIFIHGFAVPYGHYDNQILAIQKTDKVVAAGMGVALEHSAAVNYLPFKRTLYRSLKMLSGRFKFLKNVLPEELPDDLTEDQKLNGSGAHNWYVHMENNLNSATGQFDHTDYRKFTRCLNVAWTGDVNMLDYMQCIANATAAGKMLVPLLEQLIEAGLEINIIAHSAGNQVLMSLMNELGKQGKDSSIEHVFMWEAAIPDDSFSSPSTNQNPSGLYQFPEAYKVPKKITVLYSDNDNVLGSPPPGKSTMDVVDEKMDDPTAGIGIALVCAAIKKIDERPLPDHLHSVYNVANMLGIPFSRLTSDANEREVYYQKWIEKHPLDIDGRPCEKNLSAQTAQLKGLYPKSLFNLTVALQGLSSGWKGKMVDAIGWLAAEVAKLNPVTGHMNGRIIEAVWEKASPGSLQAATVLLTILVSKNGEPRPAMGYKGVPAAKLGLIKGKYIRGDQHNILTSHSAMKIPTVDMMNKIYRYYVVGNKGMKKFGKYNL